MKANKLSLEELDRMDVEAFKLAEKTPIIVVLDDIRSALNVGSFFRTSDAFALQHIYLCGITAKPPHKEIMKTAIGAHNSVDWTYVEHVESILEELRVENTIISVEQTDQSISIADFRRSKLRDSGALCLVFGNEVNGVSEAAIELSHHCVEIPQFGTKHSLNVSVCGGIVIWEFWKKLQSIN